MWAEWELNSPQVKLYMAICEGDEGKIREALEAYHQKYLEYSKFGMPVGRGIYEDGVFLDTAILSGRRDIVRLLLELGFCPVFFHGCSRGERSVDQAVLREYYQAVGPVGKQIHGPDRIKLAYMNIPGRPVWPIADDEMFCMQIEKLKDINCTEVFGITQGGQENGRLWASSWQIELTPAGFAMLTGNHRRLSWLLARGAVLEHGWPLWRERELKPLLNPFGREYNFYSHPLELAILSGDPKMVKIAVENSGEAAFYWAGNTVRGTGRSWYPKPWQYGKGYGRRLYRTYRMERAVNLADRPMWDLLWAHFHTKLEKIPICAVLEMGGGALADLMFERQVRPEGGEAHMAELELWAEKCLRRDEEPEHQLEICQYFSRHRLWYRNHMGEAYGKLRAFLLGVGWHESRHYSTGTQQYGEAAWLEFPELLANCKTDISALLRWHFFSFRPDVEEMREMAVCLKRLEREQSAKLWVDLRRINLSKYAKEDRAQIWQVLMLFRACSTPAQGLELLREVCGHCGGLLPEEMVEAAFVNGYLTEDTYMDLLQFLEEQEKYDMIAQFIRGSNRYALAAGQAGGAAADGEAKLYQQAEREEKKEILDAHQLKVYCALRRGQMEEETGLLRQAGNETSNGRLMEAVRSSGGRFLESRLRIRFWNQVYEFEGDLNLVGIAIVMGNLTLVNELLEFWKEMENQKRNPRSAYLSSDISYYSRVGDRYNVRLQYRDGGLEERPGGIIVGEAALGLDGEYPIAAIGMGPATLAITMGRLEIVAAIDGLGLLTQEEIRRGLLYTGDSGVLEYLNRDGRLAAALSGYGGLGRYLNIEPCWNWVALKWFTGWGLLTEEDRREILGRGKRFSLPKQMISEPLKEPMESQKLLDAWERALQGENAPQTAAAPILPENGL